MLQAPYRRRTLIRAFIYSLTVYSRVVVSRLFGGHPKNVLPASILITWEAVLALVQTSILGNKHHRTRTGGGPV